jgi:all-trans-retinol 13,14-reductase
MRYDVIIIGGGLGGLTAGAKLSREGKKVLLIEQHDRPGGCATTFKRGDFIFEVGLHEMYGPASGDIETKIFNELEVFKNVDFIRLPEFYRFVNDRIDITIPHDPIVAEQRLSKLFPGETDGIKAYFDQILKPKKRASENNLPEISIGEFLDSIINEEDLKLILLGNLGYYHDDPYTLSLSYYSICQGRYFYGGASFIKGGSQKLSDHLAAYIRNHGGEVLLNHIVTNIKTDNHKITGVLFKKKNDPGTGNMEASANDIIANNAMPNIVDLLPEEYSCNFKNELQHQKTGVSLLTLYLGFNRPVKELGYKYYSTFIYESIVKSQKDILKNNTDDFAIRNFTFIDYSQIDSSLAPVGKSIGTVCCIDNMRDWENLDKAAYISKKEMVALTLIERLEKLIPGIKNIIEYYEVGTPSTLKRYTLNPDGAVYGFAQTPSKKIIDTSMLPSNLHFASAWGTFGGGFTGAIYSGYFCAVNIMRKKPDVIL